jgi:hypothetical protein
MKSGRISTRRANTKEMQPDEVTNSVRYIVVEACEMCIQVPSSFKLQAQGSRLKTSMWKLRAKANPESS